MHDAAVYLLVQRDYLRFVPTESYFLRAVKNGALRQRLSAWHRRVVGIDMTDLLIAEQMTHEARHGAFSQPARAAPGHGDGMNLQAFAGRGRCGFGVSAVTTGAPGRT